jgi:translation elongation factor EF-Tu-like GTPase
MNMNHWPQVETEVTRFVAQYAQHNRQQLLCSQHQQNPLIKERGVTCAGAYVEAEILNGHYIFFLVAPN